MKKYLVSLVVLLGILIFLFWSFWGDKSKRKPLDLSEVKYAVTFSATLNHPIEEVISETLDRNIGKIVFLHESGDVSKIQEVNHRGHAIIDINYLDGNFYLHSDRYRNLIFNPQKGSFQPFDSASKYKEGKSPFWFATKGVEGLIEGLNLGDVNGEYSSSITYYYQGERKELLFHNELFTSDASIIEVGDLLAISSFNDRNDKYGIIIIDKKTNTFQKKHFPHDHTPRDGHLFLVGDHKIITYGKKKFYDGSSRYKEDMKEIRKNYLGILDLNTGETKDLVLPFEEDEATILAYLDQGVFKILTSHRRFYHFDQDLKLLKQEDAPYSDFFEALSKYRIHKIKYEDDVIAVLFVGDDGQRKGFIQEYRKSDVKPLKRYDIVWETKDWLGLGNFVRLR